MDENDQVTIDLLREKLARKNGTFFLKAIFKILDEATKGLTTVRDDVAKEIEKHTDAKID